MHTQIAIAFNNTQCKIVSTDWAYANWMKKKTIIIVTWKHNASINYFGQSYTIGIVNAYWKTPFAIHNTTNTILPLADDLM